VRSWTAYKFALAAVALAILAGAGCQDHHYVPYEQMGPLPEPEKRFAGVIVSGMVNLAPQNGLTDYTGWTLYIIARPAGGAPPLAAALTTSFQFPYAFSLTGKNIMIGEPKEGMRLIVEAKLDKDGDAGTHDPNDLFGKHDGELTIGAKDAQITLKPR